MQGKKCSTAGCNTKYHRATALTKTAAAVQTPTQNRLRLKEGIEMEHAEENDLEHEITKM